METGAPRDLDPKLAHALAHPTRSAILRTLVGTQGLELDALAEKVGVTAARLRYHLDVLRVCGAIEAVRDAGRRGEQLIRLAPLESERKPRQGPVADGLREDVSEEQLRHLIEIAGDLKTGQEGRGA